jgi:hypothetical protein
MSDPMVPSFDAGPRRAAAHDGGGQAAALAGRRPAAPLCPRGRDAGQRAAPVDRAGARPRQANDGGDLYMALELVDGPNLGEQIATSGPLPWRQVVEIGDPDRRCPRRPPPQGPHPSRREAGEHHARPSRRRVKLIDLGYRARHRELPRPEPASRPSRGARPGWAWRSARPATCPWRPASCPPTSASTCSASASPCTSCSPATARASSRSGRCTRCTPAATRRRPRPGPRRRPGARARRPHPERRRARRALAAVRSAHPEQVLALLDGRYER